MKQERAEWQEHQPGFGVRKLVFIDETGVKTSMTRARGRAPKASGAMPLSRTATGKQPPSSQDSV